MYDLETIVAMNAPKKENPPFNGLVFFDLAARLDKEFDWSQTPQGDGYWREVWENLVRNAGLDPANVSRHTHG